MYEWLYAPKRNELLDAGSDVQLTYFGPESYKPMLAHTAQSIPVILSFFETLLGSQYPYPCLQQAFIPCGFSPVASAGLQILPTSLLFTELCVEQVKLYASDPCWSSCKLTIRTRISIICRVMIPRPKLSDHDVPNPCGRKSIVKFVVPLLLEQAISRALCRAAILPLV